MKPETWIRIYRAARPALFALTDPEFAHDAAIYAGNVAGGSRFLAGLLRHEFCDDDGCLALDAGNGLKFGTPVGLAAGFHKYCEPEFIDFASALGFGSVEDGSVTALPGKGNERPRLWRLTGDNAIVNRMGLNGPGAEIACQRLAGRKHDIPAGVNIAKTHRPENPIVGDAAIQDYRCSFKRLYPVATYITLNISCPNAMDGRTFEEPKLLGGLLSEIKHSRESLEQQHGRKPVFLKVSPDLDYPDLDKLLGVAEQYGIDGYVIGNTTQKRDGLRTPREVMERIGRGGLSGPPLKQRSTEMVRYVYRNIRGNEKKPLLIGCGGIETPEDAFDKIAAGASHVQVLTGFVYNGPGFPAYLNGGIRAMLRSRGFSSLRDAVGSGVDG